MAAETYSVLHAAIRQKRTVRFVYQGLAREVSPHVLGHSRGIEKLFGYQSGGESSRKLPAGGAWRCFTVGDISELQVGKTGKWRSGNSHKQRHSCVEDVDIDVNPRAEQRYRWRESGAGSGKVRREKSPRERTPGSS
jgi:hypothetical protein